jgi:hypothetical protein
MGNPDLIAFGKPDFRWMVNVIGACPAQGQDLFFTLRENEEPGGVQRLLVHLQRKASLKDET